MIDIGHGTMLAGRYRLDERGADPRAWRGSDVSLDREVEILLLEPGHPRAADVLDAARRAGLVDDPRIARVLDVGTDDAGVHVVTERLGGRDLSRLVAGTPLAPETARRITGEVADALDSARRRGLHHLCLTPRHVVVLQDGSVRVRGLAVEAAAQGVELDAAEAAARIDALDLVRLLYTMLTGVWPGRVDPGADLGLDRAPMVAGRPVPPADLGGAVPVDLDRLCRVVLGPQDGGPRSPAEVAIALSPWAADGPVVTGTGLDASGPVRPPTGELPVVVAPPVTGEPAAARPSPGSPAPEPAAPEPAAPEPVDQEPVPVVDQQPQRTSEPDARPAEEGARSLGTVWEDAEADAPLGPLGPAVPLSRPQGRETSIVLGVVGVFVVVGLVLGLLGLRGVGEATSALLGSDESAPAVPRATASAPATPAPSAPATDPAVVAPRISGISPIDPQGDGSENDDQATRAIDGEAGSQWESERYRSATFGNLKDGIGLIVSLEQPATVSEVRVDLGGEGGTVELRTTDQQEDVEGTTVVATVERDGDGEVVLRPQTPVTTELFLLWFTELPEVERDYRVEVAEVTVR